MASSEACFTDDMTKSIQMTTDQPMRLYALDLCRGLCAFGVASYHLSMWSGTELSSFTRSLLTLFGTYGVSIFFILSGYSLAHAYESDFSRSIEYSSLRAYFRRRVGRLAPLFILVLIFSLLGKALIDTSNSFDPLMAIVNATLLFGFFNPAATPVIGGWSIGVEVVFYVVFPILMLLRRHSLVMLLIAALLTAWISNGISQQKTLEDGWSAYVAPANHWIFFCAGVYARLNGHRWRIGHVMGMACLVTSLVIAAYCVSDATELQIVTGWRRALLVILSVVVVVVVAKLSIHGKFIKNICIALGGISYPLYLLHPLIFFALKSLISEKSVISLLVLICIALLLAFFVNNYIDASIQRRVKRLGW